MSSSVDYTYTLRNNQNPTSTLVQEVASFPMQKGQEFIHVGQILASIGNCLFALENFLSP